MASDGRDDEIAGGVIRRGDASHIATMVVIERGPEFAALLAVQLAEAAAVYNGIQQAFDDEIAKREDE